MSWPWSKSLARDTTCHWLIWCDLVVIISTLCLWACSQNCQYNTNAYSTVRHSNTSMLLISGLKKFTKYSKTTHSRSRLHHQATTVYFPITNAQIYIEKSVEKTNRKCQHRTGNYVTHHSLLNSEINEQFQIISQ